MDDQLRDAAVAVLAEVGWDGLTLDRVAERAGRSRVTLWRKGIDRDTILAGLLRGLADDYRDTMLPVLTAGGDVRERLDRTLRALCDVVDAHLDLLGVSDEMFHRAYAEGGVPLGFLDPMIAVVRDARAAGRLRATGDDEEAADILFNATAWPYLHFRARHSWSAEKARALLLPTLLDGTLR
ncbi:TetR/AcrR family transcriptional regulator [Hamadaea tsunoensis]|uniref:TetR/AcrR family transcriptional regulator n=1 Tax=Hamadaea tsunoensis TaxID=53368 RepID=UPI00146FBAF7|nr:TetR/AcrR family transcriptional regulator [Hamadaea tsunoensis]